jgi:hypothetical protein
MVVLDASRRHHPVPPLAKWSLAVGIVATIGANLAHGLNHGPIGALVGAWPALARSYPDADLSRTRITCTGRVPKTVYHRHVMAAACTVSVLP